MYQSKHRASPLNPRVVPVHGIPHDAEDGTTTSGTDEMCLFTFTHDQIRVMIHETWLSDDKVLIRYHKELARYFSKIGVCQRKVEELPAHLQTCGMWSRLKDTLIDIRMFYLWWSPYNRVEFVEWWQVTQWHLG